MTKHLFILFLLLVLLLDNASCSRILCIFQMASHSHQVVFQPIWKELSLRGHQVVVVTTNPLKDKNLVNLTEIDSSATLDIAIKMNVIERVAKDQSIYTKITTVMELNYQVAEYVFNVKEFKKIYENPDEHFDLIITQSYIGPIFYALSARFKAPFIGVNSMGVWIGAHFAMGNPHPPSLFSEKYQDYNGFMTLWERVKSTFYYLWAKTYNEFVFLPKCDAIARKYLGKDLPYLGDIERNMSALFITQNPVVYPTRPYVPTTINIEQLHVHPPKPLPNDLQKVMDEAKNGVIYFSLGSNVRSFATPERFRKIVLEAVAELPYTILWKWETDEFPEKPKNVVARKWMPQQDILAHPNVKLFVTQCGLQSLEEAFSRGVPVVCIPFISEQAMNAKRMVEFNATIALDHNTFTKDEFLSAVKEVIANKWYRQRIKELHQLTTDQPMTAMERVVWWVEYVIRHKGTSHLRSPYADIPLYQFLLLDVVAVILTPVIIVAFLFCKVAKLCRCSIKTEKIKKKKQ